MQNIKINIEGKLENGKCLFGCTTNTEIDVENINRINELCQEWKIGIEDLILYFIENLTIEQAEGLIDKMDLSGIRKLFNITD